MILPVKVNSITFDEALGEARVPDLAKYPVSILLIGRNSCIACHNAAKVMEQAAGIANKHVGFGVLSLDDNNHQQVHDTINIMKLVGHDMRFVPYFVSIQHGTVERRHLDINTVGAITNVENILSGIGYGVLITPVRALTSNKRRRSDDEDDIMIGGNSAFDKEGNFIVG